MSEALKVLLAVQRARNATQRKPAARRARPDNLTALPLPGSLRRLVAPVGAPPRPRPAPLPPERDVLAFLSDLERERQEEGL